MTGVGGMTRPRLAIRDVMIAIVLIAANCVALPWLTKPLPITIIILVVLLPINLLLIGLVRIGYRLARTRSCEPFAIGLQLLGWPATIALGAATFVSLVGYDGDDWLRRYREVVDVPMSYVLGRTGIIAWVAARPGSWGELAADVAYFLVVFGIPLLVLCILGGLTFRAVVRMLSYRRSRGGPASQGTIFPDEA
jgi:hypothetical protein